MVSVACVIWMLFVVTVSSSSLNSRLSCLPFLDARSSSLSLWQPDKEYPSEAARRVLCLCMYDEDELEHMTKKGSNMKSVVLLEECSSGLHIMGF